MCKADMFIAKLKMLTSKSKKRLYGNQQSKKTTTNEKTILVIVQYSALFPDELLKTIIE